MISLQEKKSSVSASETVQNPISNSTTVNDSIASYAKKDFAGAIAMYADNAEVSDPTGRYVGKLEILSQLKSWKTAFPDAKREVTSQITDGDRVATAFTFRGTHTGPLAGSMGTIAATGKHVELEMELVNWFRGGKVFLARESFNLAGLMEQLGVARPRH
jgi:predicted ester cyclase